MTSESLAIEFFMYGRSIRGVVSVLSAMKDFSGHIRRPCLSEKPG
jgi:hypothetical protein